MHLHLIHNPKAGQQDEGEEALQAGLRARGFTLSLLAGDGGKQGLPELPRDPNSLIVVAGGDGTVGRALLQLDPDSSPLTLIPCGTANNIAFALGIGAFPAVLERPDSRAPLRHYAVGQVQGGDLRRNFVESVGFGLLTALMRTDEHPEPPLPLSVLADPDGVRRPQRLLRYLLEQWPTSPYRIDVDGRDLSGDYLLVEALNIPRIGPRLILAPEQTPDSGELVLALAGEDERAALAAYLDILLEGGEASAPVCRISGKRIVVEAQGGDMHIDDDAQLIQAAGRWVIDAAVRRVPVKT